MIALSVLLHVNKLREALQCLHSKACLMFKCMFPICNGGVKFLVLTSTMVPGCVGTLIANGPRLGFKNYSQVFMYFANDLLMVVECQSIF